MGYESRIYVVEKFSSSPITENGKKYASVIAMVDMCKFSELREIFQNNTDCYIYADGNEPTLTDCYGEELKEAKIEAVIEFLEKYQADQGYYRRVTPLLGLLKGFTSVEWRELTILHYGH